MELSDNKTDPKGPPPKAAAKNIKINLKSEPATSAAAATASTAAAAASVDKSPAAVPQRKEPNARAPSNQRAPPQVPANAAPNRPKNAADVIRMATNELAIHISNKGPKTYTTDTHEAYSRSQHSHSNWDMIIINHQQKYSKADIVEALFKITGNYEFYPVAYRPSKIGDLFLLRNCPSALQKLFQARLKLLMGDGNEINITVKLNVANYHAGQIDVETKLLQVLQKRRRNLIVVEKMPKVLDLSALLADAELAEIIINLGSGGVLAQFNATIKKNANTLLGGVRGIRLADNHLSRLSSFMQWPTTYVHLMDLSNNNIDDIQELQHLQKIIFVELIINGNPFIHHTPDYMVDLKLMFPKALKVINGTDISNLSTLKTYPTKPIMSPPKIECTSPGKPAQPSMFINPMAVVAEKRDSINPLAFVAEHRSRNTSESSARNQPAQPVPKPAIPSSSSARPKPVPAPAVPPSTRESFTPAPVPAPVAAPHSSTGAPSAVPQLKIKSFAAIAAAPLPPDVKAQAGGACSNAGDVITSDACTKSIGFLHKYKSSTMWHRIVVNHNGLHSKAEILRNIRRQLGAIDILPCYYNEYAVCDTFFVRNAYDAIEQLATAKLLVRMLEQNRICTLTLQMNVGSFKTGQIDADEQIQAAVGACFAHGGTLDLSRFGEHAELRDVELSLGNAATMAAVLMVAAKRFLGNVYRLLLCDNGLTSTQGMRPLTWMKELRCIDLSDNRIERLEALAAMPKQPTLVEFSLRGNPLEKMEPLQYINELKRTFPNLERLDGQQLGASGCCATQQNYLCSIDGYDLVEQFCEQYFSMMDGLRLMRQLYDDKALLTISCSLSGAADAGCDKGALANYASMARNLWRRSEKGWVRGVRVGGSSIVAHLKTLGRTEHDFGSFTIDLVQYSKRMAIFTVNGMYREFGDDGGAAGEASVFGFARTFVLRCQTNGIGLFGESAQFVICNEQLLVYRPSMLQLSCVFAKRPQALLAEDGCDVGALSEQERHGLVIVFQEITNLMPLWCSKFLEQADWQLRHALELFVHLCEEDKVPEQAFVEIATQIPML